MFLFLVLVFTLVSYTCLPLSFCTTLMWTLLFPIVLFWAMYNVSPLCWPMVPPRFVHDVRMEIDALIPTEVAVPRYLVQPHCTVAGKLSDGTYDPTCFLSCSEPPFLFKSWQVRCPFLLCLFSCKVTCWVAGHALMVGLRGKHPNVSVGRRVLEALEPVSGPGVIGTVLRLCDRVHRKGS